MVILPLLFLLAIRVLSLGSEPVLVLDEVCIDALEYGPDANATNPARLRPESCHVAEERELLDPELLCAVFDLLIERERLLILVEEVILHHQCRYQVSDLAGGEVVLRVSFIVLE